MVLNGPPEFKMTEDEAQYLNKELFENYLDYASRIAAWGRDTTIRLKKDER